MKKTKKRALYIIAALLAVLFVLSCLAGFAACGGGSSDPEEGPETTVPGGDDDEGTSGGGTTATISSVSVNPTTMSLTYAGETGSITATVAMSSGSYTGSYSWSSDDATESVIKLSSTDNTATVTAVATGTANVTVTVGEGSGAKSATCKVTVTISEPEPDPEPVTAVVSSVSLDPSTLALNRWDSGSSTLTATVKMSDDDASYNGSYTWSSSDDTKVTVSGSGATATVEAVAATDTAVTITVAVDNDKSATCSVTVADATVSTENGLSNVFSKGGSVALAESITVSDSALEVKADATIDLAGKTISTDENLSSGMNTIEVAEGAILTITDSSTEETGSIANTYTGAASTDNAAAIESKGTLVIESGTIESSSIGVKAEGGTVTIDGGTIESTYFALWEGGGSVDITINGGTISGENKGIVLCGDSNYGYDGYQSGVTTTLTINGGEISCESDSAITTLGVGSNSSAVITITGGTITSSATPVIDEETEEVITSCPAIYLPTGTLTITGGTISGTTAVEVRGGTVSISGGTLACLYYDETTGEIVKQGDDASQNKSGAKTYGYALSVYPYGKVSRTGYQESDNVVDVTVTAGMFDGDIYVAAQSQNKSNGNYWTVVLNGEDEVAEDAPYVVTINMSLGFTQTAYSSAGEQTCESSDDISYYIFSVNYSEVSDETDLRQAFSEGGEVALTQDITLTSGSLTIGGSGAEEVEVELDLNGNDLSSNNTSSGKANSTIYVKAGATVTIIDNSEDGTGEIDASANNTAALYSDGGTVIIAGGTFERTNEDGKEESQVSGQNSYYTVVNDGGDMTIEEGAVIFNAGDYSTCLKSSGTDLSNPAKLTINGGLIYGGKYSIKNDYSGYLTMTGGTVGGLRSEDDTLPYRALQNWDNAVITGGTLKGGNGGAIDSTDTTVDGAEAEGVVIYNNTNGQSAEGARHDHDRLGDNEVGTLTIGDDNGNGPEIIYEGVNAYAAEPIENDVDETPKFATGIAIDSGTVNFQGGTIKCTDEDEDRDYTFIGVYLTSGETTVNTATVILTGALNVSGGSISGDEAIVINGENVEATITGGTLSGTIIAYAVTVEDQVTNPLTFTGYETAGYTLTTETTGEGEDTTVSRYVYTQGTATGTGE